MKYFKLCILLIVATLSSCESMDDTYSDFFNGSKKRYIGKCTNLKVEKGLNRFKLTWDNSTDATIDKIKVKWQQGEKLDSVLLPKGTIEYITDAVFENRSYELSVIAMDADDNESIPVSEYSRPYTKDSELVNLLKVVERSYYFIGNRVIMFLYDTDRESEAYINYTSAGVEKTHKITGEEFDNLLIILENVDEDSEVAIKTSVKLEDCFDIINFEPYYLDREHRSYAADFINNLKIRYDLENIENSVLDTITTLYVSRDISTIEDILYMPKLKKVVLGGERYMTASYIQNTNYISKFTNKAASILALQIMNDFNNIEVDVYGNHYQIKDDIDFETQLALPELPELEFFDMSKWTLTTNYDTDDNGDYNNLIALNSSNKPNQEIYWKPREVFSEVRTHEVIVDMKGINNLRGIYIGQHPSSGTWEKVTPDAIEVLISKNNIDWDQPFTSYREWYLGKSPGEITLVRFNEIKSARYIKLIVKDKVTNGNNYVVLSSMVPFK